ncbi:MAG: Ig-like domain-containing protein [Patescibacteria group bacterium]|jgi:titin
MRYNLKSSFLTILITSIFLMSAHTALAHSFTVDDTGEASDDSAGNAVCHTAGGVCTLRAAVEEANALAGDDTITFSITGTIDTTSVITITSTNNTIDAGTSHNIVLSCNAKGHHGLYINNKSGNTIKGLVFQDCDRAIYIYNTSATGNKIYNNYIGTDTTGASAVANNEGVYISGAATGNYIGTNGDGNNDSTEGNVISGNTNRGVYIYNTSTNGNYVSGNYIGVTAAGTAALSNGTAGVYIYSGPSSNIIGTNGDGTSDTLERNIISGNTNDGVYISADTTDSNRVAGNYIGLNAAGNAAVANGRYGVYIYNGPESNIIGTNGDGTGDAGEGNVISGNTDNGVYITTTGSNSNRVAGNYIGLNAAGTAAIANLYGVYIYNGPESNIIGTNGDGTGDADEKNVISGNTNSGIYISSAGTPGTSSNVVAGNYIGLNAAGSGAVVNDRGVYISNSAQSNRVGTDANGTSDTLERNIISGNTLDGVYISDASTSSNTIKGNYIGTGTDGTTDFGNGHQGILIDDTAVSNTIGGSVTGEPNLIRYNGDAANEYGVSIEDTGTRYNKLSRNQIYGNQIAGIRLYDGANDGIAQPTTTGATDGGASSTITLAGACETDASGVTVEIFSSSSGQGQTYIGNTTTTNGTYTYSLTGANTATGSTLVVTSTDSESNTSIFSAERTITDLEAQALTTGTSASVNEGATASLVGASSYDPNNGDAITYLWERTAGESVSITDSDQATASFTAPYISGDSSVTVRLTVNGSDYAEITIDINGINVPPTLSSVPNQSLNENVSEDAKFDLDTYFADGEGDAITYSALNDLSATLGTMDVNANGTVDFNLAADSIGTDTIQFRATDEHGEYTDSNEITVTVNHVNHAPTKTHDIDPVSFQAGTTTPTLFDLDYYFSDTDSDALTYTVSGNTNVDVDIDAQNQVTLSALAAYNGTEYLTFTATDPSSLSVSSNQVTITVTAASDGEEEINEEVSYITGKTKGAGIVTLYNSDNESLCQINAWHEGGAIGSQIKLNNNYYISVVKYLSGSTMHIYDLNCQLVNKKKLSPKLHPRKMAVADLLGNAATEEVVISAKRDGHVYVKIYRYNVSKNTWSLLMQKSFASVPDNYSLSISNKKIFIKNGKDKTLHKWVVSS